MRNNIEQTKIFNPSKVSSLIYGDIPATISLIDDMVDFMKYGIRYDHNEGVMFMDENLLLESIKFTSRAKRIVTKMGALQDEGIQLKIEDAIINYEPFHHYLRVVDIDEMSFRISCALEILVFTGLTYPRKGCNTWQMYMWLQDWRGIVLAARNNMSYDHI